jgi:hypothetical protein
MTFRVLCMTSFAILVSKVGYTDFCSVMYAVQATSVPDDHRGLGGDQRRPVGVHHAAVGPPLQHHKILDLPGLPVDLLRTAGKLLMKRSIVLRL